MTQKYIVRANTIDGYMWFVGHDSMGDDHRDAMKMSKEPAEILVAELNSRRDSCKDGESWDNSWHQVEMIPV